jgi:hypothetical protein
MDDEEADRLFGFKPEPWQREMLESAMRGERKVFIPPRHHGRTAVRRALEKALDEQERNWFGFEVRPDETLPPDHIKPEEQK